MSPFLIEDLRLPNLPPLPGLSHFIEVNVRTYVYDEEGVPGVWFFSLDLNSAIAAKMARTTFFLPYFSAELSKTKTIDKMIVEGKRDGQSPAFIKFSYELPKEAFYEAPSETLEFFLIERYALYSFSANQLYRGRIHHLPYPISKGTVLEWSKDLLQVNSFTVSCDPDVTHYSSGVDVDIFKLITCVSVK